MGQDSPVQTKPKQNLQEILQYVVGRGYRVLWFCDSFFCSVECDDGRGIKFKIGKTTIKALDNNDDYEVYINGHGPVHLREINEESLRQAADSLVRRLKRDLTFYPSCSRWL